MGKLVMLTASMNSQLELAEWLRANVNWNIYFSLVHSLGSQLNAPKLRMDKSDLLEQGIAKFSQGKIQWVDQTGCDLILPDGTRIEMKHDSFCLHTDKRKDRKNKGKSIGNLRLVNTLSGGKERVLDQTFDYLLISDVKSAAVVSYSALKPFVIAEHDALILEGLPSSHIEYVYEPEEITIKEYECPVSYLDLKRNIQNEYLENFA